MYSSEEIQKTWCLSLKLNGYTSAVGEIWKSKNEFKVQHIRVELIVARLTSQATGQYSVLANMSQPYDFASILREHMILDPFRGWLLEVPFHTSLSQTLPECSVPFHRKLRCLSPSPNHYLLSQHVFLPLFFRLTLFFSSSPPHHTTPHPSPHLSWSGFSISSERSSSAVLRNRTIKWGTERGIRERIQERGGKREIKRWARESENLKRQGGRESVIVCVFFF